MNFVTEISTPVFWAGFMLGLTVGIIIVFAVGKIFYHFVG